METPRDVLPDALGEHVITHSQPVGSTPRQGFVTVHPVRAPDRADLTLPDRLPGRYPTDFAAARPAARPENRQPPRNVPSSER
ncbi:hypothetical protein GCM10010252_45510 [Streptomyces aureoverticillatus]|nr:hypothetical protein GCM10010252_45510 [Streptomyces aureoverticillatus]